MGDNSFEDLFESEYLASQLTYNLFHTTTPQWVELLLKCRNYCGSESS